MRVNFDDFETKSRFSEETERPVQLFPMFHYYETDHTVELHLVDPLLKFSNIRMIEDSGKLRLIGKSNKANLLGKSHDFSPPVLFVRIIELPNSINIASARKYFVNGLLIIQLEKTKRIDYES